MSLGLKLTVTLVKIVRFVSYATFWKFALAVSQRGIAIKFLTQLSVSNIGRVYFPIRNRKNGLCMIHLFFKIFISPVSQIMKEKNYLQNIWTNTSFQ